MSGLETFHRLWNAERTVFASNPRNALDAERAEATVKNCKAAPEGLLFFATSGSEGVPKWVGLSREAMRASAQAVNAHLGVSAGDVWGLALPVHHVGGFAVPLRALEAGCEVREFAQKWEVVAFAKFLQDSGTSVTSLVPTQVYDLVSAGLSAPEGLRAVVVGGGRLDLDLARRARSLGWPVLPSYGMTETASQVATFAPRRLKKSDEDFTLLDVLPIWSTQVDEAGVLRLSGAALAEGYLLVREEAVAQWVAIDKRTGLLTRDRVELIEEGGRRLLRFLGRESSFVKILGELVNIEYWEGVAREVASGLDLRSDIALVAVKDARAESRLVLLCEGDERLAERIRVEFCARAPKLVHPVRVVAVEALPRTELGKLDKTRLAQL